jgi:hypothetical protein
MKVDRVKTYREPEVTSRIHGDKTPRDLLVPVGGEALTRDQYYATLENIENLRKR